MTQKGESGFFVTLARADGVWVKGNSCKGFFM